MSWNIWACPVPHQFRSLPSFNSWSRCQNEQQTSQVKMQLLSRLALAWLFKNAWCWGSFSSVWGTSDSHCFMNYTHLLFLWIIFFFSLFYMAISHRLYLVPARSLCSVWQDVSSSVSERNLTQKLSKCCSFFSCTDAVPFSVGEYLTKSSSDTTFFQ